MVEDQKNHLVQESAKAKPFLTIALVCWIVFIAAEYFPANGPIKLVGALCLLGGLYGTSIAVFHLSTLGILKLPEHLQSLAQILLALVVATLPLMFFLLEPDARQEFPSIFYENFLTRWLIWITSVVVGYVAYVAGNVRKPILPVRGYLIAVAVVFLIVYIGAHGGFSSDDADSSSGSSHASFDPKTAIGRAHMAANYARMIIASYLGLTIGLLKSRRPIDPNENPRRHVSHG